ncbi:hypothetical protein P3X46_030196 [Hevea brasiliensis]|uniref:Uncharacterized protein n=1 Tax=Hevea brasiliensis TaxID=3981 RepID=A0ABQ9KVH6_HEVBR|nr:hypothetical protein P3X46_030196 [Hevea brasiliensis]
MDNKTSSSSHPGPQQEASNHDEFFMQQSLLFSDTIKDLKILREQLYSAAEYFEKSYSEEDQKQVVVETLKDYAIKALVNTIDHLGSVAYKVNSYSEEKISQFSALELRFSCLEQRLQTCQEYINHGGLSQQVLMVETPNYQKRYIFPVEESADTKLKFHKRSFSADYSSYQFKSGNLDAMSFNVIMNLSCLLHQDQTLYVYFNAEEGILHYSLHSFPQDKEFLRLQILRSTKNQIKELALHSGFHSGVLDPFFLREHYL